MASTPPSKTSYLKGQAGDFVKQHIEYDGSSRPEYVYTAHTDAPDGAKCSVVRYSYVGATSRIEFMKEYDGAWQAVWDLF